MKGKQEVKDEFSKAKAFRPDSPNCVTIFGAGIAGLSAAHELVERGFHVQVWERQGDQRFPRRGCDVGGMARTQWSRVHWPAERSADVGPSYDERPEWGQRTQPIASIDQKFYLCARGDSPPEIFASLGTRLLNSDEDLHLAVSDVTQVLEQNPEIRHVYVEVCYRRGVAPRSTGELLRRTDAVLGRIRTALAGSRLDIGQAIVPKGVIRRAMFKLSNLRARDPVVFEVVALERFPVDDVPDPGDGAFRTDAVVSFRVREQWLPGEHGYRFFPAFYHHLFDTMKRTPILEPEAKDDFPAEQERAASIARPEPRRYTESGRSAFDNIRPLKSQVIASAGRPSQFTRFRVQSFEEAGRYLRLFFASKAEVGFAFDLRDTARVAVRFLQFLTSSNERRRTYESRSWWDFIGGADLGYEVQCAIRHLPRALVAMDAEASDARTHGIGMAQLVLDQFRAEGYRDGTLKGPTNEAWLNPWRRYLEAQGVEFIHGELEGFEEIQVDVGEPARKAVIWPRVRLFEPRYAVRKPEPEELDARAAARPLAPAGPRPEQLTNAPAPELMPGYFIVALSPLEARRVCASYCEAAYEGGVEAAPQGSDLAKMARWVDDTVEKAVRTTAVASPHFRHFVGIQYYFAEDVFWVDGHVYYPESQWALTSVSQARFWDERTDWEHGYRGILSVIIGDFEAPGGTVEKPAFQCSPDEIAREVWVQIQHGVRRMGLHTPGASKARTVAGEVPNPLYYHLDQNFRYREGKGYENLSPFPIVSYLKPEERPGTTEGNYVLENGIVLAGAHMQTFTRLPTMESANESARRAVNAIIDHATPDERAPGDVRSRLRRRALCDLWNPEEREVEDLAFYKEIDRELHNRGVPHVFDVLGVDTIVRDLLRGGADDPLDPVVLLSRLRRILDTFVRR